MPHPDLWSMFAASAARFAEQTAVEILRPDRVDRYTYRELRDLASARAAWLASQGVSRGDRVAILAHNDAHWCAAYLGILKLGAIAVPLDTNYSPEQVTTIVRDSGAKLMFVSEKMRPNATDAGIELLALHSEPHPLEPVEPLEPLEPGSSAVILYTSGTTSDPKGVVLSHANLLAERDAAFAVVTVTERDAILGVLPLFHSLAQLANLLLPFAVGARVVYLETINSADLVRALSERRISIFACVPQFFYLIHQRVMQQVEKSGLVKRLVFKVLLATSFRLRRLGVNIGPLVFGKVHDVMGRDMRLLVTGGSKFDPAIGRDLYALGFTILQAYGLTETSAACTINTPDEAHIDTVGRPLPGVALKLVKEKPDDSEGEIAVRGPIVMQGYYRRPDATAAVMQDGWFLTGDLGRIDAGGRVTITGRKKEMIVLASGKNIYPEEIEAHYRKSPFIKEICVMGLAEPGRPMTERLYAVVVPDMDVMRQRKIVNAGDILRFEIEGLAVGLPAHKRVLGYEVSFEPLPRTTTQKIKRHEVERRVRARQQSAQQSDAPLPAADLAWLERREAAVAAPLIQARVKTGARVRPDANLELDLGLDSMERVELLTELEQTFGVRVPQAAAVEIFTVRQLVEALASQAEGGTAAATADTQSWAALLRDLPPPTDPELGRLLRRRTWSAPLIWALLRLVRLLFVRVRVSGLDRLPPAGPYIISPNHQSYVDPFVLCGLLPYRVFKDLFFVGAVEYFETPFTKWVAHLANLVPVDPDSNLVPAMKAGAFGLAHGKILVLFPEGERSIDGTVKKFKKGAPILAQHLGVPIVPVAIKGVYELWPRNRGINWLLVAPWSGHRVSIEIGEPLTFDEGANYSDSAVRLRDEVQRMWMSIGS
jgi:long-chain acyl-CoA synthetase